MEFPNAFVDCHFDGTRAPSLRVRRIPRVNSFMVGRPVHRAVGPRVSPPTGWTISASLRLSWDVPASRKYSLQKLAGTCRSIRSADWQTLPILGLIASIQQEGILLADYAVHKHRPLCSGPWTLRIG